MLNSTCSKCWDTFTGINHANNAKSSPAKIIHMSIPPKTKTFALQNLLVNFVCDEHNKIHSSLLKMHSWDSECVFCTSLQLSEQETWVHQRVSKCFHKPSRSLWSRRTRFWMTDVIILNYSQKKSVITHQHDVVVETVKVLLWWYRLVSEDGFVCSQKNRFQNYFGGAASFHSGRSSDGLGLWGETRRFRCRDCIFSPCDTQGKSVNQLEMWTQHF